MKCERCQGPIDTTREQYVGNGALTHYRHASCPSTPHEVAHALRERMESAKRAASNPEAGSVYAFEYLLSACEAACARLDLHDDDEEEEGDFPVASMGPDAWRELDNLQSGRVSDAEAEAAADAACGSPVESATSRVFGPGPARLAARFPVMKRGGR